MSFSSVFVLGLVFGLKHALDVDHVAAVTSLASGRRSLLGSTLVGAWWGVGHTVALLAAGILVIVFRIQISDGVATFLELGVAAMLIYLGGETLWKLARSRQIHVHVHKHGERAHVHPHAHEHAHEHAHAAPPEAHHGVPGQRPFFVGIVHGLAGSAALMLLIASTIPSPALGFVYIAAFGVGSIGGMVAMTAVVGVPAILTARRYRSADVAVRAAAGVFSLSVGAILTYQLAG